MTFFKTWTWPKFPNFVINFLFFRRLPKLSTPFNFNIKGVAKVNYYFPAQVKNKEVKFHEALWGDVVKSARWSEIHMFSDII